MRRANPIIQQSDRLVTTPLVIRDLRVTAYCQLASNAETELLAAEAGAYHDLVELECLNTSSVAVTVNIKESTGGQIVRTFELPALTNFQRKYEVPIPQSETASVWTVEFGVGDISNTDIYFWATFAKELTLPE